MKLVLLFIFLSSTFFAKAGDSIVVKKDPRLEILTQKQIQVNKRTSLMTSSGMYKGFRVQIISTNKRDEAFNLKAEMMNKFPDQNVHILFQSPYFKVRVGDFFKKEDAEKFRKQLNKLFPQGVYVVEDLIDYTPTDEDISSQ